MAVFDLGKFFRLVLSFFEAQALLTNINLQPEKKIWGTNNRTCNICEKEIF